jgi:Tat protein secretion system quality control protein TatD with DNase activity
MIIDSHCHLHDEAFADAGETLRVSMAHDVYGIVAVGCDAPSNELTLAAAGGLPGPSTPA